jgi:hypothetical protein
MTSTIFSSTPMSMLPGQEYCTGNSCIWTCSHSVAPLFGVTATTHPSRGRFAVAQSRENGFPLLVAPAHANRHGADTKQRLAGGFREQQGGFASTATVMSNVVASAGTSSISEHVPNAASCAFISCPLRAVKDTTLWSASGDPRCKRHDASSCFRRIDEGFGYRPRRIWLRWVM